MTVRTGRSALSSLLTLGLLLLPGGIRAAAGGSTIETPSAGAATVQMLTIEDLAESGAPEGFELQEVSVLTGEDAEGAEEVVSAKYLGAGTRNEIRYITFSTEQAADAFLGSLDRDSCSVRTLATCATRLANRVVAGLSASTCPHPTEGIPERASSLRDFGITQLKTLS